MHMPGVTTEGIILKRSNFGEADRILTILTDRYGKISVTARGVRKITSRRAGNVEILNRVKLHLFKGKGYTLTEAESLDTFQRLKENLILTTTAFHLIELIDRMVLEGQSDTRIYDLLTSTLKILERNPRQIIVRAFEVKLLSLLGFWSLESLKEADINTKELLSKLLYGSWAEIEGVKIEQRQAVALEQALRYYIEKTIESELKSMEVLRKLKV